MNQATKKIIQNVLRQFRKAAMSTTELVNRIEAAENERVLNNRKALNKLDQDKRLFCRTKKTDNGEHHDNTTL